MQTHLLSAAIALLSLVSPVIAQGDITHHRATYERINADVPTMQKVTATHKDEPLVFALTGWLHDGEVKKITARSNEDGGGVEEYYLENEQPLFVFNTYTRANDEDERGAKIEERLYLKDGVVFKWLTTEKPAPVLHAEDYEATTERLNANCAAFVAALKAGKPETKPAATTKTLEGTFTGIEEGDFAHWKMQTKSGDERSFFIIKPDAILEKVLASPDDFVGKPCRVTWKKSTETLPDVGRLEVQQITTVEWHTPKPARP